MPKSPPKPLTPLAERRRASKVAAWCAAGAFVVFVGILLSSASTNGTDAASPATTATVSVSKTMTPGTPSTTEVVNSPAPVAAPGEEALPATTTTTVTSSSDISTETTETTTPVVPDTSWAGRIFGYPGALLVFLFLIAAFAAFLVGLFIQRVLLGEYGFKFAGIEVAALGEISKEQVATVSQEAITKEDLPSGPQTLQENPLLMGLVDNHRGLAFEVADLRLALIDQRVDLELLLRALGAAIGLAAGATPSTILFNLEAKKHINAAFSDALEKLLSLGDLLANGVTIEASVAITLKEKNGKAIDKLIHLK